MHSVLDKSSTSIFSLEWLSSGAGNTGIGSRTLDAIVTGSHNTAIGYRAGSAVSGGGTGLTAVGSGACQTVTGADCAAFGYLALQLSTGLLNSAFG